MLQYIVVKQAVVSKLADFGLLFDSLIFERWVYKMQEEKRKALESVFGQIEKQYGAGAVMRLGEKTSAEVDFLCALCYNIAVESALKGICICLGT